MGHADAGSAQQPSSPGWIPQKKGSVRQTGQESTRSRTKMQTHEKKDVPLDGAMPDGQVRRRRRSGQGPRTTRHSGSHPSLRDALHGVTATLVVTRPPFRGVVYYPNLESSPQLSPGDLARPRRLRRLSKRRRSSRPIRQARSLGLTNPATNKCTWTHLLVTSTMARTW